MIAVDTNVLIYAIDNRQPEKQSAANELIEKSPDGVLLWQVVCEYLAASRKIEGHSTKQALEDIKIMQKAWRIGYPNFRNAEKAIELQKKYNLSFWDAMIVAAAILANVKTLYSEDFDAYKKIESLTLLNPFK